MDEERDLVVFEDEDGNELTMEVLDYFFYEGQEYALMAEAQEECGECGNETCEECDVERDIFVMRVDKVGEDEEEFVPIEDELSDKLIAIIGDGLYDDSEFDDEDDSDL